MKFYKLVSRNDASDAMWVYEILYQRGELIPSYLHARPELVAVLCGQMEMTFDGVRRVLHKGDVVFLAAGVESSNTVVTRPARIVRCTVNDTLFARAGLTERMTILRSELLEGALSRLVSEARLSDRGMPLALEAAALGVFAAAHRQLHSPDSLSAIEKRMEEAIRLVRDTTYTLHEIALRCGFCDQPHLTRAFRRDLGVGPAEYRRRHTFAA